MTQQELGDILGCSDQTVSKMERGVHMMKVWRMIILCDRFQISLDYLVRGVCSEDVDEVPVQLVEMYKSADQEELSILNDHMDSAIREIQRLRELKNLHSEQIKNLHFEQ